jgi:hypothetical protein
MSINYSVEVVFLIEQKHFFLNFQLVKIVFYKYMNFKADEKFPNEKNFSRLIFLKLIYKKSTLI